MIIHLYMAENYPYTYWTSLNPRDYARWGEWAWVGVDNLRTGRGYDIMGVSFDEINSQGRNHAEEAYGTN